MQVILAKDLHPDKVEEFVSGLKENGNQVREPLFDDVYCPAPFGRGSTYNVLSTEYIEVGTDNNVPFGTLYANVELA